MASTIRCLVFGKQQRFDIENKRPSSNKSANGIENNKRICGKI